MYKINEVQDETDPIDTMNQGTPGVSGSLKKARNANNVERPSASKHAPAYPDYEYT